MPVVAHERLVRAEHAERVVAAAGVDVPQQHVGAGSCCDVRDRRAGLPVDQCVLRGELAHVERGAVRRSERRVELAEHEHRLAVERGRGRVVRLVGCCSGAHDERAVQAERRLVLRVGRETGLVEVGARREAGELVGAGRVLRRSRAVRHQTLPGEQQRRRLGQRVVERDRDGVAGVHEDGRSTRLGDRRRAGTRRRGVAPDRGRRRCPAGVVERGRARLGAQRDRHGGASWCCAGVGRRDPERNSKRDGRSGKSDDSCPTVSQRHPRSGWGDGWIVPHDGLRLTRHGQLLESGGSIRMYVIGPVMFTPHEVIW